MTLGSVGRLFLIVAVFTLSLAWGIGRAMTDRISSIQFLHWIPTIVVLVITVLGASALSCSKWRRCRRLLWMIACVQAVVFIAQDYGIARARSIIADDERSLIRIAHINVNWPGENAQEIARGLSNSFGDMYGEQGPDVLFISEYGGVLAASIAPMYCAPDTTAVSIGRFAVVGRVPIVEVFPLCDDRKSTAVFVRFAPWNGNPSWAAILVDVPSDPAISRVKVLGELRAHLDALSAPSPDLIVGDFNTARGGESIRAFAPKMHDAFSQAGVGFGATFPRAFPLWHIDQMLLATRVTVLRYEIVDTGIGKHRMQTAVIRIASE